MIEARIRRQAAYYLGLSELVEARLATSPKYVYATRALEAAWQWMDGQHVTGETLADLACDEEGFGVVGSMGIEKDRTLLPAWGCVSHAICFTSFAAYLADGKTRNDMVEGIDSADDPSGHEWFLKHFRTAIPLETMLPRYQVALDALPDDNLTRSVVRDAVFAALHAAAADSGA